MSMFSMSDKKDRDALIEGAKKALCVVINAAMFFYFPPWVFGDGSWTPADPVWVHITITMLCELGTMDRLNEKILLRTAGTTIGAISGCIMTFSSLNDMTRLGIIAVWITILGVIEKKDPNRSYIWTIGTVTFGISAFLGRKGMYMTPWKRWFSIILGTIITCIVQLLLPYLGVLPKNTCGDELYEAAKSAWNGSVAMLEDAIENPKDVEAGKRLVAKQTAVHGSLSKWSASWKQYSYARNWINLQPKKELPLDGLKALLSNFLFQVFLSTSAAARVLHRTGQTPVKDSYAEMRVELHKIGASVASAIAVVGDAQDALGPDTKERGMKDLASAVAAIEIAWTKLAEMSRAHQTLLAEVLSDMVNVVVHLHGPIADVNGAVSVKARCDVLLKGLSNMEAAAVSDKAYHADS